MTEGPGVVQVIVDPQRQREHLRRAKSVKMVAEELQTEKEEILISLDNMLSFS